MNTMLRNRLTACFAVLATMLMAVCLPGVARAADLRPTNTNHYFLYTIGGTLNSIGSIAQDDSSDYYCIESGPLVNYVIESVRVIKSTDESRRLAWLIEHNRGSDDTMNYAAISMLAHDHFDLNPETWKSRRDIVIDRFDGILERADALWREAGSHAASHAKVTQRYVQGLRQGTVEAVVSNAAGSVVPGVTYTVTLEGPAQFENGKSSVTGVSASHAVKHLWQATGAGEVSASISYDRPVLEQVVSPQDFARFGGMEQAKGDAVTFAARKDFSPSLATQVSAKVVDAGQPVIDEVSSGVQGTDSHWPEGMELLASGWYFDKLVAGALNEGMSARRGEGASAFLKRLEAMGHRPSAYGSASFTGPGQSTDVRATAQPGGSEAYQAPAAAGFGTWVWAFERDAQSRQAQEYMLADVVTPFLEIAETSAHRALVKVQSSVSDHSASVGSELSDTITVSGFPDDHGSFAGSEEFGFGPDTAHAQVSVWWSGDAEDAGNDEQYRPIGAEEPGEDEHHRLIGTWDYPAANGTFRVGAGAPDAQGNPVSIHAERHGWYVFVWKFAGDDRVMPAASAYDDAWERTRVDNVTPPEPERKRPVISTQVDHEKVKVNEPFRDIARVIGDVEEGSYVEFDVYEAVAKSVKPGANAKLLDGERVPLEHGLSDQKVHSSQVRSGKPGFVYWKATVFSAKGDVLATHELGAEGEVVEVVEDDNPPRPAPDEPVKLARTGSSVAVVAGIGLAAVFVAVLAVAAIRRRA
ncbi:MAG: peptidase [Bifidobacterium sp.]|nr:peptidase [Bifidobacterium sp.]